MASFMGKIAKLDSAMQRGLDNSFAFVFGGRVVPAEIEELLKQEAEDNLVRTYEGGIEAPNVFQVHVSAKDAVNLSTNHPTLAEDFADQLMRYERNQGWKCAGPMTIRIGVDESLRTGQLRAKTSSDANASGRCGFVGLSKLAKDYPELRAQRKPAPAESPATEAPASTEVFEASSAQPVSAESTPDEAAPVASVSLLLQDGSSRTFRVEEGSNIIGRSNDVDFRLPDTGVSREHAEITFNGQEAILVDLQSTNGTSVNDMPIDNWLLADGDVITVGHSNIEVRIVHRPQGQA